jgi:hypothetical protein
MYHRLTAWVEILPFDALGRYQAKLVQRIHLISAAAGP